MSFTLIDSGSEGFEFRSNVWNWKTVLEIIRSLDVLSEGKLRQMTYNATGVQITKEEVREISEKIRTKFLPDLEPNKRIFIDLSITDKPDDGTIYRDEDDNWKNYSANYSFLSDFCDFCDSSKGFQVF